MLWPLDHAAGHEPLSGGNHLFTPCNPTTFFLIHRLLLLAERFVPSHCFLLLTSY